MGNNLDPVSIAAGIGAGQEIGRREAGIATDAARTRADIAEIHARSAGEQARVAGANAVAVGIALVQERNRNEALENEIHNRWIPYGIRLKASIIARKVEREILIEELKKANPANADAIIQHADQARLAEYDHQTKGAELAEVNRLVREESEAGRLG